MENLAYPDLPSPQAKRTLHLMGREEFAAGLENYLEKNPQTKGGIVYFDVQRFTVINSIFGMAEGDRLLAYIGEAILQAAAPEAFVCHFGADRFALFVFGEREEVIKRTHILLDRIAGYEIPFDIRCNVGIYPIHGQESSIYLAIDGAIMAQKEVKGSFIHRYFFYNEELRRKMLADQEIVGVMSKALAREEFVVYYQPQYNHSTNRLTGAEALVRWSHPKNGLMTPDRFMSLFERTGFVAELDQYVFERVCRFLRRQMDEGADMVPVSVNLAGYDIFLPGFAERLEKTRMEYAVPPEYIHLEITESCTLGNSTFINQILDVFHHYGYLVAMDDFGSGYSSLTILKDIDFDMIKLDTCFFRKSERHKGRGEVILSFVVHMMNSLKLPVIAEGVEEEEQADFLKSIGCDLIQGFLYAMPQREESFVKLLQSV